MHKHARNAALAIIALLVALPLATANAKWLDKTEPNVPFGVYVNGRQGSAVRSHTSHNDGRVTSTDGLRSGGSPPLDERPGDAAMNRRLSADAILRTHTCKGPVDL